MYPSISASSNGKIGYDNFKFTSYPKGFCEGEDLTRIATYYYKENYVFPYKYTVATITDAEGVVNYFDDIEKAVNAASETDVIKLTYDITESVIVDKKITIDRNK